jgi:chromate transporter
LRWKRGCADAEFPAGDEARPDRRGKVSGADYRETENSETALRRGAAGVSAQSGRSGAKGKHLFSLFAVFLKIGAFTIGGGYAMLPLIRREVVEKRCWADDNEMMDIITVGQSLPGVIAINAATAVGGKVGGAAGAALATAGVVFPSLAVMSVIAAVFGAAYENALIQNVFSGARPAVAGLMAGAALKLGKAAIGGKRQAAFALAAFGAISAGFPAPYALLACGGLAVICHYVRKLIEK